MGLPPFQQPREDTACARRFQILHNVVGNNLNSDIDYATHGTGALQISPKNLSLAVRWQSCASVSCPFRQPSPAQPSLAHLGFAGAAQVPLVANISAVIAIHTLRVEGLDTFDQFDILQPVDLHSFALGVSIDRLRIIADVGVSLRMHHGGRLQTVRTWLRAL